MYFFNRWSFFKLATSNLVHTLGLGLAYQKNVLDQNWRGVGQGSIQKKSGTPYLFLQPLKLTTSNLVHNLGLGLAYQETTFRTKISGGLVWARGAHKKMWAPYLFLLPLKLAISNLVHKFGLGLAYQKRRLRPKLAGVLARGASQKNWTPTYFCNRWN